LETFEKFSERKLFAAGGVARIAIAEIIARTAITEIITATNFIARIATLRCEQAFQPFSKRELFAAGIITTDIATGITVADFVTRRTSNNTVTRTAFTRRAGATGNKVFETRKQVTRLGTTVARTAGITSGITRTAVACKDPGAHQQGDDESGH